MAKKSNSIKKIEIVTKIIEKCFTELGVYLEVLHETKDLIILSSPVLSSDVNFTIQVLLLRKSKLISVRICKYKEIEESNINTLIEFANRINKLYGDAGYLSIDPSERLMISKFALELIDHKINKSQLKSNFEMVLSNAVRYFDFIEGIDVSDFNSGELLLQYIEYNKVSNKFRNKNLN